MSRIQQTQLNVRSSFARDRAMALARETGMTATQVVEEALRAYVPMSEADGVGALERRGPLLVMPARGRIVTLDEANAALEAVRNRDEEEDD
jgi:hypothetical protein